VLAVRCGGAFKHKARFAAARSSVYKMNQENTSPDEILMNNE
jgi:hypothetical protein